MPSRINLNPANVLLLPAVLMPIFAVYGTMRLSILFAVSAGLIALILIYRRSLPSLPPKIITIAIVALITWCGLSSIWAHEASYSLERIGKLVGIAVGLYLLIGAAQLIDAKTSCRLTFALAGGWLIAAILMILEVYFDGGILLQNIRGPWLHDVAALKALKRGGTILLILSWALAFGLNNTGHRVVAILVLLLPGYFLILIGGIAAMISWMVGLLIGIFAWILPRKLTFRLALATTLVLLATPLATSNIPANLTQLTDRISSPGIHRLAMWKFTTDRIFDRPIMGWGLENSRDIPGGREIVPISEWVRANPTTLRMHPSLPALLDDNPPEFLPLHPHNVILQIWLELGLIGVVLFGFAAVSIILTIEKYATSAPMRAGSYAVSSVYVTIACLSFGAWQTWWLSSMIFTAVFFLALKSDNERIGLNSL